MTYFKGKSVIFDILTPPPKRPSRFGSPGGRMEPRCLSEIAVRWVLKPVSAHAAVWSDTVAKDFLCFKSVWQWVTIKVTMKIDKNLTHHDHPHETPETVIPGQKRPFLAIISRQNAIWKWPYFALKVTFRCLSRSWHCLYRKTLFKNRHFSYHHAPTQKVTQPLWLSEIPGNWLFKPCEKRKNHGSKAKNGHFYYQNHFLSHSGPYINRAPQSLKGKSALLSAIGPVRDDFVINHATWDDSPKTTLHCVTNCVWKCKKRNFSYTQSCQTRIISEL